MNGVRRATARVDAGSRVGLGHLRRTQTLLAELARRGCAVGFVGRVDAAASAALRGLALVDLPAAEAPSELSDAEQTLAKIGLPENRDSWVIVDHYELGERWERAVGAAGHRVLAIDDFRNRPHHAEIVVSDTAEPFGRGVDRFPGGALQLTGPQYVLLDAEFMLVEKTMLTPDEAPRILVTYGAADPTAETIKALEAIRRSRSRELGRPLGAIDVVVGPANRRKEEVARLVRELRGIQLHDSPPSLAPLLRAADIVLTAGGNTVVEALSIGRPCLVTETAANQASMVEFLVAEGAVHSLGSHSSVDPEALLEGLVKLAAVRAQLAARLCERPVFDTRGASRIVRAIEARSGNGNGGTRRPGIASPVEGG